MSVADALQSALYQKLVEETDYSVFNFVPDNQEGDFIVIGSDTYSDFSGDCFLGFDATVTISVWTLPTADQKYQGMMQCNKIMGELYDILHRSELQLEGYANLSITFEFQDIFRQPDGLSYQGVQRYRFYLEKTETIT